MLNCIKIYNIGAQKRFYLQWKKYNSKFYKWFCAFFVKVVINNFNNNNILTYLCILTHVY